MSKVDPITAHILDTNTGKPAQGVIVQIYTTNNNQENLIITSEPFAMSKTDNDGRIKNWSFNPDNDFNKTGVNGNNWEHLVKGIYKIKFLTGKYFKDNSSETFFPFIEIFFEVNDISKHYHIPLLLSNFSYTTYRGS
ncbi:uncharacterized protein KGF55_001454 [Candida pseudojiufengensis]|uniref:uncharacterized protein n=1 Tax=Candida pseudojiufengensis TaxID=497109 RepID=UPI0022244F70|nr:uncharacterized protein KGF55_001454 [Candida pseudojiufengensis]KAI5965234.1 hypothetical protein KGF55_001454 [Candida pseudojiufengensis]